MRGSYYNRSVGIGYVGDIDLLVGNLASVASEVTVDVGVLCVVTLYSAVIAGSYVPVMSIIGEPSRGIEGVLVTVIESAYVTFAVSIAVNVVTLILVCEVTAAGRSEPMLSVLYNVVVYPLVGVSTYLERTYVAEAVFVIIKVSCRVMLYLVITVGVMPMVFGIVVPFGLGSMGAELIVTLVTDTVVVCIGVRCGVSLL